MSTVAHAVVLPAAVCLIHSVWIVYSATALILCQLWLCGRFAMPVASQAATVAHLLPHNAPALL
jgi:hypothetical protein